MIQVVFLIFRKIVFGLDNYPWYFLCGSNASHFLSASIIKKQNKFYFLTLSLKDRT